MNQPLVATLSIAPDAQAYFNDLRTQHFPKERNYLNAHLTLFNALPDEPWIFEKMQIATADQAVFEVNVDASVAKRLQEELRSTFEPFCFTADGVHLWRYLGGPWEFVRLIGSKVVNVQSPSSSLSHLQKCTREAAENHSLPYHLIL